MSNLLRNKWFYLLAGLIIILVVIGILLMQGEEQEIPISEWMIGSGETKVIRNCGEGRTEEIRISGDPIFQGEYPRSKMYALEEESMNRVEPSEWRYKIVYNANNQSEGRITVYISDLWLCVDGVYYSMPYMVDFSRSIDGIWDFYVKSGVEVHDDTEA